MPFYKGEHITFDVVPGKLDFVVNHDSLTLEKTFTVAGFSVSGQVLDAANVSIPHTIRIKNENKN